MILAVAILTATGWFSYHNHSSIISALRITIKPDNRMLSVREISMDLEKAHSSIRIYSISKDTLDIKPYFFIISRIDEKVSGLRSEFLDDPPLLKETDTISKLIEGNIIIWNKLLYLNNNRKVVETLQKMSDGLNLASDGAHKAEKNILKHVFNRNDTGKSDQEVRIIGTKKPEKQLSMTGIDLKIRESQLVRSADEVKEQFNEHQGKIEDEISILNESKSSVVSHLARKAYFWLALFYFSGTALAIIVMFILIRLVIKTPSS